LSDIFPIKTGLKKNALSPLLFRFALRYDIRSIHVNHDDYKLNGTHHLLVYDDDDVNILGGSVHTVKRNGEAFLFCSKDNGLEVPADKPK